MDALLMEESEFDPRIFVFNFTSGTVYAAYGTVIVLAIAFGIAAIGGLLFYGLQGAASRGYGYSSDSYDYGRYLSILCITRS